MLKNYDKYQEIWYQNLETYETARARLNKKGLTLNNKINREQHSVDMTLQDRLDYFHQEKQNVNALLDSTFKPKFNMLDW